MPVTSTDLWKLLKQSRLLPEERLEQVRSAFSQAGSEPEQIPAKVLAQWLLQHQWLTPYQAKVLLNGRSGPFHYGDYQLQERIHGGRFGRTFLAVHVPSRFAVQLKFASSRVAQDPRQWNTARQYIHTVTPIVHEQLQRVFALEDQTGYRYLVLERLVGRSLAEQLAEDGRLQISAACRLVRLAAHGLAALHEGRSVHGDVRPVNLWIESGDNVKLVRDNLHPPVVPALWQADLTDTEVAQADYMAPELAHPGTLLSPMTDIYALGCTLYQLLAGSTPFAGDNAPEKLQRHANDPVSPIQTQSVPAGLIDVLEAMLAKDPAARIPHALDVAERLLPFIDPALQAIPTSAPSATLLAFEESLGSTIVSAPPAPPPVIPEADAHPPLPEPPVQTAASPPQIAAESVPEAVAESDAPAPQSIPVISQPRRSRQIDRLGRRRRSRRKQAITLSVLAVGLLIVAVGVVAWNPQLQESLFGRRDVAKTEQPETSSPTQPKQVVVDSEKGSATNIDATLGQYEVRRDNGKLLWMTPTHGPPVQLQYVAPGAQLLLIARPHDLVNSPHGKQVLRALGPSLDTVRQAWETAAGYTFDQIDQLIVCLHTTETIPVVSMIVRLQTPQSREQLQVAWGSPAPKAYSNQDFYEANGWAFLIPKQEPITQFVMGRPELIREVIDAQDAPPLLRRELARLVQASDRDRHLSLVCAPDFLIQDLMPQEQSPDPLQPLRETVAWLLGQDVKAGMLSMQFDEAFFLELRAYGQVDLDSLALADALQNRIGEIPDKIESVFEQIYPSVYWRRVALRFPEMIRFLHRYSRVGVEDGQAIVNTVLPGQAAHNLLFGAEMLLGMQTGPDAEGGSSPDSVSTPSVPQTLDELIEQPTDLSFDQKSLEFAIADLATDIRETYPRLPFSFDIQIVGTDLQLNGITRNQQIAQFTADNQTIAEVLTAIVMRANPITTVSEPSETDQKLVWVLAPDPTDPKKRIVLITTRDAAQRKGYNLPATFQPN